jgi:hypothetical protein
MTDDHVRKRPQRVQLACLPCRQGKLKCNRIAPACDQCVKRARESACIYTERGLKYNAAKLKSEAMRDKVDRLESFVSQLRQSENLAAPTIAPNGLKTATDHGDLNQATGRLRLTDTGGVQYVGSAHWESIIEDISEVKAYFDLQGSPDSVDDDDMGETSHNDFARADIPLATAQVYSKADLLSFLPDKSMIDRLVAAWFRTADPLRMVLHAPSFQTQYQAFWRNPQNVNPAWLALLLSLCSAGAELSGQISRDTGMLKLAESFMRLTPHALILADYYRPQLYVIEALLMHIKAILMKHNEVTPEAYIVLGCVTRLCTQGGYHKDPVHNPAITPFCGEMRRRLWNVVCA